MSWMKTGPVDFLNSMEAVENEISEDGQRQRMQRTRAQAYAQVCHSMGCTMKTMSDSQRAVAEAKVRQMMGERTQPKGGDDVRHNGFRIPCAGRMPNVK